MWDLSKRLTLETSDDPMVSEEVFDLTDSESHSLVIEQTQDRVRWEEKRGAGPGGFNFDERFEDEPKHRHLCKSVLGDAEVICCRMSRMSRLPSDVKNVESEWSEWSEWNHSRELGGAPYYGTLCSFPPTVSSLLRVVYSCRLVPKSRWPQPSPSFHQQNCPSRLILSTPRLLPLPRATTYPSDPMVVCRCSTETWSYRQESRRRRERWAAQKSSLKIQLARQVQRVQRSGQA